MFSRSKQSGTAIVIALFMTALVAGIAMIMAVHLQTDIHRTRLILNHIQLSLYLDGEIDWAKNQLIHNWQNQHAGHLVDQTPIFSPLNKIEGSIISAVIEDEQTKFNLNNVLDPQYQIVFLRLLNLIDPTLPEEEAQHILKGLLDWITPGIRGSAFDLFYEQKNPPYRSPHQRLMSVSELQLIKGMTPALFQKILPYITALPEKTTMNINGMAALLLKSLDPSLTDNVVSEMIQIRKNTPFLSMDAFLKRFPMISTSAHVKNMLNVTSQYFLVRAHANKDDQSMWLYTLLHRKIQPLTLQIVWQSQGTV